MCWRGKVRVAALALAMGALSPLLTTSARATSPSEEAKTMTALLRSRELWATIDVCNPHDQPDYVGVRGSMPGDKRPHDKMYMSFKLQYLDAATKKWIDLVRGGTPAFTYVGPGSSVRQGGSSFQLVPRAGQPAYTLRGVVSFRWRRGSRVLGSATRTTTAGHKSVSGADPAGYSTASCVIG
jgi:hypothetical protein